jgi:hypothetical protein
MTDFSNYLFARPSFIEGMARVVDLGGTLNEYNTSMDAAQADRLAFAADILALRQDYEIALQRLRAGTTPDVGA